MNRASKHRAVALTLAAIATLATANGVLAAPLSTDVRAACPGIDTALQNAMTLPLMRNQVVGTVRVDMQLEGQRVVGVSTPEGPLVYRKAVQRAVRDLNCSGGDGDEHRTISFNVQFSDEIKGRAQG
jgi:hypothetical protein